MTRLASTTEALAGIRAFATSGIVVIYLPPGSVAVTSNLEPADPWPPLPPIFVPVARIRPPHWCRTASPVVPVLRSAPATRPALPRRPVVRTHRSSVRRFACRP